MILKWRNKVDDFFKWVKGTELVELDNIDVSEDPVRPELTLGFRITHGRKIFGLKYNDEIEAIICVAFCPEIPYTVREMDYMSRVDGGEIAIAYTVWSRKRGAGREIIIKLREWVIKNGFKRLVTLSPLTPMATHFHIKNGAKQIKVSEETQNFEYKL
jgi:GNAT superfamily N-acetyltransferase